MKNNVSDIRHRAARLARDYLENKITWRDFVDQMPQSTGDKLLDELTDLIEHQPKRGGLMGLNEKEWQTYQRQVHTLIKRLES